jgi:hypothetical protein
MTKETASAASCGDAVPSDAEAASPSAQQATEAASDRAAAIEAAKERPEFWNGVLRAVGAEPTSATEVGGASGVRHSALAIGVDEAEKRLVVVSPEGDARSAALAQADIQSAVADYRIIVARPMIVSAGQVGAAIAESVGTQMLSMRSLGMLSNFDLTQGVVDRKQFQTVFQSHFLGAFELIDKWMQTSSSVGGPPFLQILKQIIDQASLIQVQDEDDDVKIDFSKAIASSPGILDTQLGVCGFPLYAMTEIDLDAFLAGADLDEAKNVLRRYGVMQFFFPAPDQLLLGAIDRGAPVASPDQPALMASRLGHPPGTMELVAADTKVTDLIDALSERKLLVSGEVSVELSDEGLRERATVKFTPRESIISKIVNRISVSIDLKQMFGIQVGGGYSRDVKKK